MARSGSSAIAICGSAWWPPAARWTTRSARRPTPRRPARPPTRPPARRWWTSSTRARASCASRPTPVAWSWLALGSVARRELTLASDQDNALALANGGGKPADDFFADVAEAVNAGLARCGFGADRAEVLARSHAWRMEADQWRATFA